MSRDWRFIASRLNGDGTETFLDWDVPLIDPQITDSLSAPNGLSGRIAPELKRLVGSDGLPLFREWSTALYAEQDGQIHGGGILAHSGFDGASWDLECVGFVGYLKDMPYTGAGEKFVETDTLDIVRHIWSHVQAQDGGNLGMTLDPKKSGLLVGSELASEEYDPEGGAGGLTLQTQAYKLAWYQDHDLQSNLDGLAADTPFDYHERHFWEGDTIRHHLDFGVPTIGRRREDLRFVVGENIFVRPAVDRPGEDYASEVYALGAGEGATMIRGRAIRSRDRLRRVAIVSDSSMRRTYRANSLAQAELAWRHQLDDFTTVILRDHPHAPIGSVGVGDEIYIGGDTGWLEIGGWCRVLSRTLRPDSAGVMELNVARTDRLTS